MNRIEILALLHQLFDVPTEIEGDLDLREFIKDSIDVGEFVAEARQQHNLEIEISDFKGITHLQQLVALLKSKNTR